MTIAGFTAAGIDTGKHFVVGGGTTQEVLLVLSFVVFGLILLSFAVGACTRCRSHASAARYTSPRR
jgi:hypothetical protein